MLPGRFEDAFLDPRKLRYFLEIVDSGGFGRAAERLMVSQSSLSQSIASLERMLGFPLFHRVGRGVVVSDAGLALVGPARVILRDIEVAAAGARSTAQGLVGRLDVVSMPSPGISPLASLVAAFTAAHPDVRVNITAAFTPDDVIEALHTGRSEVGVLGSPDWVRSSGLTMIEFESQPMILVSGPDIDPFGTASVVRTANLDGLRLVESQRGSLMRRFVDDAAARGIRLSVAVEVAHRTSILPLVAAGVGHAVLPSAWEATAQSLGLHTRRIQDAPALKVAVFSRAGALTPAAAGFLRTVSDAATPRR